jgi:hypothetical protein
MGRERREEKRREGRKRDVFFEDRSLHLYNMTQNILYIK